MRTTAILGLFALAFLAAPALLAQEAEEAEAEKAEETKGVQWTEDYAEALKTAKAENKRLFLEFTATW